jgi:uncharacterized protein YebE (UPF0316 family)
MIYKEIIENDWYVSIIVFVTQIAFLYFRTVNVIYTTKHNMIGAILTNIGTSITWIVSTGFSMNSFITGSWLPIVSFVLGGIIGTYYGVKKEI